MICIVTGLDIRACPEALGDPALDAKAIVRTSVYLIQHCYRRILSSWKEEEPSEPLWDEIRNTAEAYFELYAIIGVIIELS